MIVEIGKKTKSESTPAIILHFLFGMIYVVIIIILKLFSKFAYLECLCFTVIESIKSINFSSNSLTNSNAFASIGFLLLAYGIIIITITRNK